MSIFYKGGYKYQLQEDYVHPFGGTFPLLDSAVPTVICSLLGRYAKEIETKYLWLGAGPGWGANQMSLIVKSGYAWDGPSGPTIDTKNFMRGSLVHDALYQLMRLGYLEKNIYRKFADRELQRICLEDGMWRIRAQFVYWGVRIGGNPGSRYGNENPIIEAPKPRLRSLKIQ